MQLTGKQIIEKGILTGVDLEHAVQQQGVDVRVIGINEVVGTGFIPKNGKTKLPQYNELVPSLQEIDGEERLVWNLKPGYYEILLEEGCKMSSNVAMTFVQRSSALRCGTIIRSSQFDAGFETEHMGTFMQVFLPITIEKGARIAQTLVMETAEVGKEDLYNGQWQGDKQRKV